MGTYKIIIAGNNEQLFTVADYVKKTIPSADIVAIITYGPSYHSDNEISKISKDLNLPTIYSEIEKIDWKAKTVYFNIEGNMSFDYFIATATYVSPIKSEFLTNVIYFDEEDLSAKIKKNLKQDQQFILIISDKKNNEHINQVQQNFPNLNIKKQRAPEIKQIHAFENKATSVTLSNDELMLVDLIIVTTFELAMPSYLQELDQSFMKLETNHIYYIESKEDLIKLETLILRAKPQEKYLCPSQRKLINACKYLEEDIPNCESYSYEICKMHNEFRFELSTYLTRFIEGKLNGILQGDICNLCNLSQCKLPFRLCGIDEEEITIRRILNIMFDSLMTRSDLNKRNLQIPKKIFSLRDTFTVFNQRELKQIFRWIVHQNRKIVNELNDFIPAVKPIEIKSGIGSMDPNKDIVLYVSKCSNRFSTFYPLIKENENLQIVTLGCGGLEISNQFGFSHFGNLTLCEYIAKIQNLKLVIIENPCYSKPLDKILSNKKIPIIDLNSIDVEQFASTIRRIQPSILQNNQTQERANDSILIGNPDTNEINHYEENIIFLLPCQGDYQENNLYLEVNRLIEMDFSIYSFGCSISSLMSMNYLNPIYLYEKDHRMKTYCSFSKLLAIAETLKAKNKYVYAYNLLKADALLDLFSLIYFYDFRVWDFENINNNIRTMMTFCNEGNKNDKN